MSILEKMRSGQDSTFMQVVIAVIIIGFIGLNGQVFGDKSAIVATVNGDLILETEYRRAYNEEQNRREMQQQRTLSDSEQRQLGEEVKQALIEDLVVLQEARRLGLEVSDREVARQVRDIPGLRGEDGKFSQELLASFLKRIGFTHGEFQERIRESLLREKLRQLVFTGASLSEPAVREAFVEAQTRVELTLVQVRPQAFDGQVTITDEERTKWLTENDALAKQTYDADFERLYNHPEQVQLRMIRLAVRDETPLSDLVPRLNALRDQVSEGADMATLAKRWSEDPSALDGGDLGLRPSAQLSTDMSRAIDGVADGALSRVFTTTSDARFVRVERRLAPSKEDFESVKGAIADRLIKAERVPALAQQFAEAEVLPKWTELSAPPDELLATRGFFARPTGPISAQGGRGVPPEMLEDARSEPVLTVFPRVYEFGGSYYVGQLTARVEPDMSEFEANKDKIAEIVLQQRRVEFFQDWIADLKARATIGSG
jgi:peptidyl-prolyl cis-trans isomerase D